MLIDHRADFPHNFLLFVVYDIPPFLAFFWTEQETSEWSSDMTPRIAIFRSFPGNFEILKSNLVHAEYVEKCCSLNLESVCLEYLTLQILHKFHFPLTSINLKSGEPFFASRGHSKNILKSTLKMFFFFSLRSKFNRKFFKSMNVLSCSTLYLHYKNWLKWIECYQSFSKINICLNICFFTLIFLY